MSLVVGARLGPYEIQSAIGAGGMGEVYKARDMQLKRDVALKVLPADVATDAEHLARFRREAELLAALNHPHIAQVYGVADEGGVRAIVMELVEGPTLAERIARGPVPLDEALPLATQLAEALEYAHERGIIHRDLKPANIKLTADGAVKVLDFGLAKAFDASSAAGSPTPFSDPSNSPTMTSPAVMTRVGIILGTAAYMSPEQARGAVVDKRADVWAFGVVLFEMLTGKPCFAGETVTDVLAAVVKTEPQWSGLPAVTPLRLRELLERCLAKDRKQRLRDMGDARIDLERILAAPASSAERRRSKSSLTVGLVVAATSVVALAGMVFLVVSGPWPRGEQVQPRVARFYIMAPTGLQIPVRARAASISPDAKAVAYVAEGDRQPGLWIRPIALTDAEAWRVPDSDGAVAAPFWKPDGREAAFAVPGTLRAVNVESRAVRPVCSLPAAIDPDIDGAWSDDGQMVFGVSATGINFTGQIWQVPAAGGVAKALNDSLGHDRENWAYPQFLRDGRLMVATFVAGGPMQLRLGTPLNRVPDARVPVAVGGPLALAAGHLVFGGENTLMAQAIDEATLRLRGEPQVITAGVQFAHVMGALVPHYSVAGDALVYRAGGQATSRFSVVDRQGATMASAVGEAGEYVTFSLARDGRTIVAGRTEPDKRGIWRIDVATGKSWPLVRSPEQYAGDPMLGREGFVTYDVGLATRDVWEMPIDGGSATQLPGGNVLQDRSRDGAWLLMGEHSSLRAYPVRQSGPPVDLVVDGRMVDQGRFSPDAGTVAYNSSESGRFEVWVVRRPRTGEKQQVSRGGGVQPLWRDDGKELYYLAPDGTLMAVEVKCAEGARCEIGAPQALFATGIRSPSHQVEEYGNRGDGQRFVILKPSGDAGPLTVLLNWRQLLPN